MNINSIIKEHIMETEYRKRLAQDYLNAYTNAQAMDLVFEREIRIQFGNKANRYAHATDTYSKPVLRAYMDKVSADHECQRILHVMRDAGASLADLDGLELL